MSFVWTLTSIGFLPARAADKTSDWIVSILKAFAGIPGTTITVPFSTFHLGSIGVGCSDTTNSVSSWESPDCRNTTTLEVLFVNKPFAHLNGSVIKLPSPI